MHHAMHRTFALLTAVVALVAVAAAARAAEPQRPSANRPVWGTVTKVTGESMTIAPEAPAPGRIARRRGQPADPKPAPAGAAPAERTFALAADDTEFMFAEVGMRRLMADGTTLRTLAHPEPATAADVKAGQLVEVTPGDGGDDAAARVTIAWSVPGTIVNVTNDSITFRPAPAPAADPGVRRTAAADADAAANPGDAKPSPDAAAAEPEQRTLKIHKDATRVRIATARPPEPSPTGRGFVTAIDYRNATTADLKPEQNVVVCVKDDTAAKITIHVASDAP